MFIESKNSIQSLQENALDNRPILQENFFFEVKEQKKTTQTKKGAEIFDKIFKEKEEEKEKFELNNETSFGLDSKNRYRTVHLEMDNFNDYMILYDKFKIPFRWKRRKI